MQRKPPTHVAHANSRTSNLPDLSFLEPRNRKAKSNRSFTKQEHPNLHTQSTGATSATVGDHTALSLISPSTTTKDNITRHEALRISKVWFDGKIKQLKDRLELAERTRSGLEELLTSLDLFESIHSESVNQVQFHGTSMHVVGMGSLEGIYGHLEKSDRFGTGLDAMYAGSLERDKKLQLELAKAEKQVEECVSNVRMLRARWNAAGRKI